MTENRLHIYKRPCCTCRCGPRYEPLSRTPYLGASTPSSDWGSPFVFGRGEAQRQATRPAARRCLSSARRAWRLTVGPASPRTLGRMKPTAVCPPPTPMLASRATTARRSSAAQAVQWQARRETFGKFSLGLAVASQLRTVQGLTPRSSGAPTAAHQARSVVREHSPQPGPGGLPSAPA